MTYAPPLSQRGPVPFLTRKLFAISAIHFPQEPLKHQTRHREMRHGFYTRLNWFEKFLEPIK